MTDLKFFSEEWCAEATRVEQIRSDEVVKTFKNPAKFNHVLAFAVADRPGVFAQAEYVEGRLKAWTSGSLYSDDEVWSSFRANLEHYQEATSGKTEPTKLFMGGKIRLVKGTMKDAMENAKALDLLMKIWGTVPTDWDI